MRFFVTCAKGLEYLLVDEIQRLGGRATAALAGVNAEGNLAQAQAIVMHSRLASRVLWPLFDFDCLDQQALYDALLVKEWSEHLTPERTLAIDAEVDVRIIRHSKFAAQRVKDAIVDHFRAQALTRPTIDTERPEVRLNLYLRKGRARLSVDLGGGTLHRRGWRQTRTAAPLKETLAAAVLLRGGWPEIYAQGGELYDPMCGSGTLLIEGALMAADVAPGLQRYRDTLPTHWRGFDAHRWLELREQAKCAAEIGLNALNPVFMGSDIDPQAIRAAHVNAQAAGVADKMTWDIAAIATAVERKTRRGLVVCNPPYDQRLAADGAFYSDFGATLRRIAPGWRASLLCGDAELALHTGLRAKRKYQLFNGALECILIVCDPIAFERPSVAEAALSDGALMVANRLRKNLRHSKAWRAREQVTCYRVYDADLPEYAAAIDVYQEAVAPQRRFLHVQEYAAPETIPEPDVRRRRNELLAAARQVFELTPEHVAVKTRKRGKGGARYGKLRQRDQFCIVEENGARIRVNLYDYLDTGLFLDHRPLRRRMAQEAHGKRFLNLFCYTGVASVQAAVAGARETVSVDLSATYLQWCALNFQLNGLSGAAHRLIQADALRWLESESERYDLIFCDPPTFSNSARTQDFDVQRDHVRLLRAGIQCLRPDGVLYFSNNFKRFKLERDAIDAFAVCEDITATTIGLDFARTPRIHRCWRLMPKVKGSERSD